jgi:hypothetical protein
VEAELLLNTKDINDEKFKERVTQELVVRILGQGTRLRVALNDRMCWADEKLEKISGIPSGATRIAEIQLGPLKKFQKPEKLFPGEIEKGGGLWLRVRGLDKCELETGTVILPEEFEGETAVSLNHAFTRLSERYETHRIAHTGNVYEKVFYQEENERWYPLDDLRQGVLHEVERKLLVATWKEVEKQLGWHPKSKGKPHRSEDR